MKTKFVYLVRDDEEKEKHHRHAHHKEHHHDEEHHEHHHEEEHEHHKEKSGDSIKNADYFKYIAKHGHHFSKELSKYAVEKLYGSEKMSYDKIEEIFRQSDEMLSDGDTIADLHFVVNRMKHRHSSTTIKSDAHIVMLSIESLNDPMSDEVFCEWIECMKRRKEEIPWSHFI